MWARDNFFFFFILFSFRKQPPRGPLRNAVVGQRPWLTMTDGRRY